MKKTAILGLLVLLLLITTAAASPQLTINSDTQECGVFDPQKSKSAPPGFTTHTLNYNEEGIARIRTFFGVCTIEDDSIEKCCQELGLTYKQEMLGSPLLTDDQQSTKKFFTKKNRDIGPNVLFNTMIWLSVALMSAMIVAAYILRKKKRLEEVD